MNVQQAIADFLQHGQAERNLSDRTIRAYQSDLSQFHFHISDAETGDITPEHLDAAARAEGVEVRAGDVVLVRTGWARFWEDAASSTSTELQTS